MFFVMQPFLTSILVAAVLATLFYEKYQFLLRLFGGRKGLSATGILLLVAFLIIIPIFFLATMVVGEATRALSAFSSGSHSIAEVAQTMQERLSTFH